MRKRCSRGLVGWKVGQLGYFMQFSWFDVRIRYEYEYAIRVWSIDLNSFRVVSPIDYSAGQPYCNGELEVIN